jgi:hypothetical protein
MRREIINLSNVAWRTHDAATKFAMRVQLSRRDAAHLRARREQTRNSFANCLRHNGKSAKSSRKRRLNDA